MFRILQKNKQFFSELNKYFDNFVVKLTYVNYSSSENTVAVKLRQTVTIMIRLSHVFACEAF